MTGKYMTGKRHRSLTSKLAMAAIVATGMAASPLALSSHGAVTANTATAQEATDFVNGGAGSTVDVHENVYRILGTTRDEVRRESRQDSASTENGPLQAYQHAMRSGNLDSAATALAAVSNRPITKNQVNALNTDLGIDSRLTDGQVATTAADRQDPADVTMEAYGLEKNMARSAYGESGTLDTNSPAFKDYERAMTRGNLDAAADALNKATDRPVTEAFVLKVNRDLGVESTLTAQQVANAASSRRNAY